MLNPSEYDPEELRALTGAAAPSRADEGDGETQWDWVTPADFLGRAEACVRATQMEDAFLLQAAAGGADRPYLPDLPGSEVGTRLVLDWLSYLVGVGGRPNARDALAFYRRVDWLGADAERALAAHLGGFAPGAGNPLGVGHHRTSLLFVARLAALR
ncbi:FlaD/FlaE family flagellar protein [Candidatus Halobonum tyrrellensis]|uniref:Fla cluster protein flaD n=1 Tax=Candidatus Halobonum tyrrellensis G22 TaxID=1324957 RepID=V4HN56_9EURY|nr:FlaD/FlaE family flagellar protein [Candidatus Halobonum tyrrellensis]ESP89329.1 fla cluster protein flaD [Candidatus Halobonum tyrrellensis G22]